MNRWGTRGLCGVSILLLVGGFMSSGAAREQAAPPSPPGASNEREAIGRFVDLYCVACHNRDDKTAGLALDAISSEDVSRNPEAWEKVVRKLVARQMPPEGEVRPSGRSVRRVRLPARRLARPRGRRAPDPGRTDTFRRLNRTEYQNAIRDLLALDIDASALLPNDESSHGFDNVTVGDLSPTLLDRYITAAQKISRLAVGQPGPVARRRHDPHPAGPHPGGARRGAADRHARRGVDPVHVPARRRIRDPGPPGAGPQRARRGPARAARAGGAAGPRAKGVVHGDAAQDRRRTIRPPTRT